MRRETALLCSCPDRVRCEFHECAFSFVVLDAKSECSDGLIELWLQVRVHGTGRLLMFSSVEPSKCLLDGSPIEHEYDNHSSRLVVTLPKSKGLDHNLTLIL